MIETRLDTVRRYHERSTHHLHRFALGPGHLDWANQPDPFRTYEGAPLVELPLAGDELTASWDDLHRPGAIGPRPLDRASLGAFFELALGLTAWKEYRHARWSLRANPSSGNLHPTEGYAFVGEAGDVPAGLYHYRSRDHVLERRLTAPASASALARLLPSGGFLLGLASIHWREAWKYGERAFRYCQQDAGHALAAARYAAAVLGWSARLLDAPGNADVATILGLDRDEDWPGLDPADREEPEALVLVATAAVAAAGAARPVEADLDALVSLMRQGDWAGRPNALSPEHVGWPSIAAVADATRKPRTDPAVAWEEAAVIPEVPGLPVSALRLIRRRRSAVDMDGATSVPGPAFYRMLDRLIPRRRVPPWDVLPWAPRVHPLIFVHRVDGLPAGLYILERSPAAHEALRASVRPTFRWERPPGCPEGLGLFLLEEGDARPFARLSSCHQAIAADSSFSLAMLADLGPALDEGPWWYRRLHWEAGVLGQVLYMEAEAAGRQATGIGCFFDETVHSLLGLEDDRFRDLYHFTLGGAVEDPRLTTLPGYSDEVRRRPTLFQASQRSRISGRSRWRESSATRGSR